MFGVQEARKLSSGTVQADYEFMLWRNNPEASEVWSQVYPWIKIRKLLVQERLQDHLVFKVDQKCYIWCEDSETDRQPVQLFVIRGPGSFNVEEINDWSYVFGIWPWNSCVLPICQ